MNNLDEIKKEYENTLKKLEEIKDDAIGVIVYRFTNEIKKEISNYECGFVSGEDFVTFVLEVAKKHKKDLDEINKNLTSKK